MPPENDNNQSELEQLRAQLAQREQELALVRQENSNLEELVVNGPLFQKARDEVNTRSTPSSTPSTTPSSTTPPALDVDTVAKKLTETVKTVAKEIVQDENWKKDQVARANDLLKSDATFKLYMDEIKAVAREHPGMTIDDAYAVAKARWPGKKEAPPEPRVRDVGNIRQSTKPTDRFSGMERVATKEAADQRWDRTFDSAIEVGLKEAGFDAR